MKTRLNQATIPTLAVGNHWDLQDGLLLRISATCKSWYFYKHNPNTGKPIRRSLGKWPAMSVEAARKAARTMQGSLDKGETLAASMTLGALLDLYEKHLKARKIRHPGYAREVFNLRWSGIASRKLSKLTAAELQSMHDDIAIKRGALAAARAIKNLRALLNYAVDQDLAERNPAKKVRVRADTKRDVFLNTHELAVFRKVLATKSQDVQDFHLEAGDLPLERGDFLLEGDLFGAPCFPVLKRLVAVRLRNVAEGGHDLIGLRELSVGVEEPLRSGGGLGKRRGSYFAGHVWLTSRGVVGVYKRTPFLPVHADGILCQP